MTEQHHRLQQARIRAGYANASEAARFFAWNENTYRSHENGERGLKVGVASKYAKAFDVDPGWLMTGHGEPGIRFSTGIEIEGLIDGNGIVQKTFDREKFSVRSLPFAILDELNAYLVLSDGVRNLSFGDLILTGSEPPEDLKRFNAIVHLDDGRARFGEFLRGKQDDGLLLTKGEMIRFDSGEPIRVEAVHVVVPAGFHTLRTPISQIA